jgi:hypothetical protein
VTATASYTYITSYAGLLTGTDHYIWQAGAVPAGGWGIITVTAQVTNTLGITLSNDVSIYGQYDRNPFNDQATATAVLERHLVYLPLVLRRYP